MLRDFTAREPWVALAASAIGGAVVVGIAAGLPAAARMVAVRVADSGSGIDPEVASRLFHPFVTTKRTGMGIGLSLSRTIVDSHGGQITVDPNPGGGTVFCFTVPRADPEEIEAGN